MKFPRQDSVQSHRRGAYTLIEMLIASGLVAVLMSAAWGLMSLYTGMLSAGRSGAAEQQLARSLFRLMADDARQAVLPESAETLTQRAHEGPDNAIDSSPPPGLLQTGMSAEPTDDLFGQTEIGAVTPVADIALIGTEQTLRITGLPAAELDSTFPDETTRTPNSFDADTQPASENRGFIESQLKTVIYRFEPPQAQRPQDERWPSGLHRVELDAQRAIAIATEGTTDDANDRLLLAMVVGTMLEEVNPDEAYEDRIAHEHAPEVVRCRFRYFDGTAWQSEWDSQSAQSLPAAIQIQLWLVSRQEHNAIEQTLNPSLDDMDATSLTLGQTAPLGGSDPLAAIQPRLYERLILLSMPRQPAATDDSFGLADFNRRSGGVSNR